MIPAPVAPYRPDREQRLDAIDHVVYGYANLISAARYSLYDDAPWRTYCDDAFLLACRKIEDFLTSKCRSVLCKDPNDFGILRWPSSLPEQHRRTRPPCHQAVGESKSRIPSL